MKVPDASTDPHSPYRPPPMIDETPSRLIDDSPPGRRMRSPIPLPEIAFYSFAASGATIVAMLVLSDAGWLAGSHALLAAFLGLPCLLLVLFSVFAVYLMRPREMGVKAVTSKSFRLVLSAPAAMAIFVPTSIAAAAAAGAGPGGELAIFIGGFVGYFLACCRIAAAVRSKLTVSP